MIKQNGVLHVLCNILILQTGLRANFNIQQDCHKVQACTACYTCIRWNAKMPLCRNGAGGWTGRIIGMITQGDPIAVYTYNTRAYNTPLETTYVLCYKSEV